MLYFSLIDILFMFVGVLVGVILTSCISGSGYIHKCDYCVYKDVLEIMEAEENE